VAEASVTLLDTQSAASTSWTGLLAQELDVVQQGLDDGPCLEAARRGVPIWIPNMRAEHRWPDFAEQALRRGVLSAFALPLLAGRQARGALDLYSTKVSGLDARARRTAGQYAQLGSDVLTRMSA